MDGLLQELQTFSIIGWIGWISGFFLGFLFETVTQAYEPRTPKSRPRPLRIKLVDPEKNKGIKIVEKHLNII